MSRMLRLKTISLALGHALLWLVLVANMADAKDDKFPLIPAAETDAVTEFQFADLPNLSGTVVAPSEMQWDDVDIVPPEFADFAVFSQFEQRYVGYIPQHRDRFEVRMYVGKIFPTRVALGAGYSAMLASEWGKLNFGIKTHDLTFGEVLGGDKSTGVMFVNRIATWRRGEHVFIMRITFEAEHYAQFEQDIARLIGSWTFSEPLTEDPILTAMKTSQIDPNVGTAQAPAPFQFAMPSHWEILTQGNVNAPGDSQMWVDRDNPVGNLGTVITALPSPVPVPETGMPRPPEQGMIDVAADYARIAIQNMLPDTGYELKPFEMNGFDNLEEITAFNRALIFTAPLETGLTANIAVLLVQMLDGVILASATLRPTIEDGYQMGTQMHGSFVSAHLLEAMTKYAERTAAQYR